MNDDTAPKPHPPRRRWPIVVAVAVTLPLAATGWLGASEAGLRLLCAGLARISDGRLQIEAPEGRLLGDWRAQSVRWLDAAHDVELRRLQVSWTPRELLRGRLAIERIEADSVRYVAAPSSTAMTMPDSLQLPLPVSIKRLVVGALLSGQPDASPTMLARSVDATLSSAGRQHRIDHLQARVGALELAGDATLAANPPFDLRAAAVVSGSALDQSFKLDLRGSGQLAQLGVEGEVVAGADAVGGNAKAAGTLSALLTPFAERPLASLAMHFTGIDPAVFAPDVPHALLDIDAMLQSKPADGSAVSGELRVSNQRAGALDRQLIPVERLQTGLDWKDGRLAFPDLTLALSGGGWLKGRGAVVDGRLELDLDAHAVDARAVHGDLLPTRLAGPLRAQLGNERQNFDLQLRDAQYAIDARASVADEAVEVARLQLAAGDARLAAQGRLALTGEKRFTAQGELRNFDPARFFKMKSPLRSLFNADLAASGALGPALELALTFNLRDSRLGTQKLGGKGVIDLRGAHLRKIDVDLDAAGNRLNAAGAFGRAGDSLRLRLQAPRLETIGLAGLAGDAKADIVVGGMADNLEFSGELQSEQLRLAESLVLRGLSFHGQLAPGSQGHLRGRLRCTACAMPAQGIPALTVELDVEGMRSQHRLTGQLGLSEEKERRRELRFVLDGGLAAQAKRRSGAASSLAWRGVLSELNLGSRQTASSAPLLHLVKPAALSIAGSAVAFGPAAFDGLVGDLRLEQLALDKGRWQSAGRWQQIRPQTLLAEFPSLHARLTALSAANPQPLVLAGDWTLVLDGKPAALPVGRIGVWRESGDLVFGDLALGLSEARVQASLGEGRLVATAQLRGARLGEISADFTAPSARRADGSIAALIDPAAAWMGRLQASVPDVGWLGPFIGEGWQTAGRLQGEMRLGGSPAQPQLSGEWRGDALALRALDLGMRLERGKALVEITPDRLLLRELVFDSEFAPLPEVLKLDHSIDAASLTGKPGRVEASGELDFATAAKGGDARLNVRLDRLGVVQRADQWIALSGDGELRVGEQALDVGGKLRIDAGLWSLAEAGRPRLSDDVVIRRQQATGDTVGKSQVVRRLRLDIEAALGRSVHFRGAGVESRLAGQIRVRSDNAGLPRASGSIRTVDGRFDAYGQKLGIQRGIINFQGAIDNPGLNILAVRENLPVEAGVEVTGTAQRPSIRLVSTPEVPDTEKLSWLVLGHAPEQQGAADSGVLLAAARTILGGQDGGVLRQLQRGLGIDEFGVSTGEIGGYGNQPTSRVASSSGFSGNQTVSGQIVSVGKRLSSNALLSYEQSLNTSDSIVKLTVNLGRRFSLVGRAGSESALDFFWHYRFGK